MSVILRRKVDKIDESLLGNNTNYPKNTYKTCQKIYDILSSLIDAKISLNFVMTSKEKKYYLRSHHNISRYKLAGNIIEAFVMRVLADNKIIIDKDNNNINSNKSPDFIYNNVKFEIKAYNKNITNLSLGRYETIKNDLLSDNEQSDYKTMIAIVFKYELDDKNKQIIIKQLDIIPLIYLINNKFTLKGGGSSSVIAQLNDTENDYNTQLNKLINKLNNK